MNPIVETGALIGAAILVGITLIFVPVPRHKPPEFDKPPAETPQAPTPQEVVSEKDHLENIEAKLLHIQQQVQRMEKKVE